MCSSSWSVVVLGINRPFLLPATRGSVRTLGAQEFLAQGAQLHAHAPAHIRPMIRVPATDVRTMGIVSASSDSNTE